MFFPRGMLQFQISNVYYLYEFNIIINKLKFFF